jgi:hypothetical protein
MSFVSDLAKFNMKNAQRQQLLGGAHLSWQPGNVDFAPSQAVDLNAEGAQGPGLHLGRSQYTVVGDKSTLSIL